MGYRYFPDREARDEWIRLLADLGFRTGVIAEMVDVHRSTVWEVLNPERHAYHKARRATYNTSPEGLQRQRDYRARKAR